MFKYTALLVVAVATALASAVGGTAALSESAPIVFGSNRADGVRELYVVNSDGSGEHRLTFNSIFERQPVWSPDGARIAFAGLADGNWDIYTIDRNGGQLQRLTTDPERDDYPKWTTDGRIVFQRGPFACPCRAWIMDGDGANAAELPISGNVLTPEPAPHGQRIVYSTDRDGSWSLHVSQLNGFADRQITTGPAFGDFNPRWSPNGNDIAFLRDHTGTDNDVYVVHADGTELRQLTDTADRPEFWPAWSHDGSEVLFQAGAGPTRLRAVSVVDGTERAVPTWPRAPLAEDFADGVRDASLWHEIVDAGASVAETNGRLEISIAPGSVPGGPYNQIDGHYGSQCSLPGDYDFQVEWQLVQWPEIGFYAALQAFFANAGISRNAAPYGQQYVGWSDGLGSGLPSTDSAGTFRLVRTGASQYAYVRPAGASSWTLVFEGPAVPGDSVYGMGLWAPGDWYTGLGASVAFDDFLLSSGELVCPDWWSDLFPDVY